MLDIETSFENLFKSNPDFLKVCQRFGWGQIEVVVKDGQPVLVSLKKDIKLK
jgi:hypothetical protein